MKRHLALLLCALALAATAPSAAAEEHTSTVYPSTQSILINGEVKELHAYARKDSNGFLTNYVKIRDMAALLSLTTARFDVNWNDGVEIAPGRP